jgi:hypothetical protein
LLGFVGPIGHQAAGFCVLPQATHERQAVLDREICQPLAMKEGHRVRQDQNRLCSLLGHCFEGVVELLGVSHRQRMHLHA